jgi:predicted phosphodiesterase
MSYSKEKLLKIKELVDAIGRQAAAKELKISVETVKRSLREFKQDPSQKSITFNPNGVLKKISEMYTDNELQAISMGGRILPGIEKVPIISFEGKHLKIGYLTDTHIGHLKFSEERLMQAFDEFRKEGVDFIVHAGDVTEGMSHRPGHIYELTHLGYEQQKEYAIKLFGQWTDTDIYAIDGNHDRWFIKSNGAYIVKDIDRALDNFHFIGHDEGDISLGGKTTLKLWHGEDSSSYALSYRLQKIVESMSGGEKPGLMICGHTHKYVKIFERNINVISAGCIEAQTAWMRGKRIGAAVGFGIVDVWVADKGISKISDTFYPFYC